MRDERVGLAFRAVRLHRGWRQSDVSASAGVSRSVVSRIERGHLDSVALPHLRAVASALDIRLEHIVYWRGGDLDRILNARHGAMHEWVASLFAALPEWTCAPEVTFSIYGERGSIDLLAWHPARRILLIVELKTEVPDPAALVAQVDRYRRLARAIGREHGWDASIASVWVIVADSHTNRRRVARHRAMLRNALPDDGRTLRRWLREPVGAVRALSFVANDHPANERTVGPRFAPQKRVRRRGAASASATASSTAAASNT